MLNIVLRVSWIQRAWYWVCSPFTDQPRLVSGGTVSGWGSNAKCRNAGLSNFVYPPCVKLPPSLYNNPSYKQSIHSSWENLSVEKLKNSHQKCLLKMTLITFNFIITAFAYQKSWSILGRFTGAVICYADLLFNRLSSWIFLQRTIIELPDCPDSLCARLH